MTETSSTSRPPLPMPWVRKIFQTMQGHYGTRFLNMWKTGQTSSDGADLGVINAMEHWAEKLAGYADQPKTIARALENLPPEPPSLPQFMEILRRSWVPPENPMLEHKLTPEQMARNQARAKEALDKIRKSWGMTNENF